MTCSVQRRSAFRPGAWPGGTTTELFIYPSGTRYEARDFAVRASTASVELETSDFSDLAGYRRLIMLVEGEMHLTFEGHGEAILAPLEVAAFDGGWSTRSRGKCTDFNLMLGPGWDGELLALQTPDRYPFRPHSVCGLYCLTDGTHVTVNAGNAPSFVAILDKGDLLRVEGGAELEIAHARTNGSAVLFSAWQSSPAVPG